MNRTPTFPLILLGCVALFAVPLGSYAGGYVMLSRVVPVSVTAAIE